MQHRIMHAAVIAALTLAGVSPVRAAPLPQAKPERATLCSRAALVYATLGEDLPAEDRDHRDQLLRTTLDATDFYTEIGLDEDAGLARLTDAKLQQMMFEGNWLTTLNACKVTYGLGDPEPVPALPADPAQHPAACSAVALVRAIGAAEGDVEAASQGVMRDPASAYFQLYAVRQAGDQDKADAAMSRQVDWAVTTGTVDALARQCLDAFPAAARFAPAPLPADRSEAGAACAFNVGLFIGLGGDASERAKILEKKLRAIESSLAPTAFDSAAELIDQALALGPPFDLLAACEARFG